MTKQYRITLDSFSRGAENPETPGWIEGRHIHLQASGDALEIIHELQDLIIIMGEKAKKEGLKGWRPTKCMKLHAR